jgi:nucleotide-binding universal stress UspA family protein
MIKILVPTDYSPEAKNAMLYAFEFAMYTGSSLLLYHAMPNVIPLTDIPFENYYLDEAQEQDLLLTSFQKLITDNKLNPAQIKVEAVVDQQNLVHVGIEVCCKKHQCDLVIMGTHGASGIKKIFLGSNTSQYIANASMPVIAVPSSYRFEPIYHLIYASDLRNLNEELGILVPFAEVFHAVLEILYFDYAGPESEQIMIDAKTLLSTNNYKNIKLNIKRGNIHLSVAENLKNHIDAANTQLLVMVSGEHNWFDSLMIGSNAQQMVLEPKLPILVMRKGEI